MVEKDLLNAKLVHTYRNFKYFDLTEFYSG